MSKQHLLGNQLGGDSNPTPPPPEPSKTETPRFTILSPLQSGTMEVVNVEAYDKIERENQELREKVGKLRNSPQAFYQKHLTGQHELENLRQQLSITREIGERLYQLARLTYKAERKELSDWRKLNPKP